MAAGHGFHTGQPRLFDRHQLLRQSIVRVGTVENGRVGDTAGRYIRDHGKSSVQRSNYRLIDCTHRDACLQRSGTVIGGRC